MSDGAPLTLEMLRIGSGDLFACVRCGVPKSRDEFQDESIACKRCAPFLTPREVNEETLRKKRFDASLEQLRDSQEPAIPGGVQRAHEILKGKTSSELLAEAIYEIRHGKTTDGKPTFLPRDGKLFVRALETFQRAEIKHDEFLKHQGPPNDLSFEEAQSLSIDTFISELTRDKSLRKKVLGILYERCPELITELMEIANVTVLSEQSQQLTDLENGGVI